MRPTFGVGWAYSPAILLLLATSTRANPPIAEYIFPAGGQRGTSVQVRVGGCNFHGDAGFEMLGSGITASPRIHEIDTIWFEGPLIFQPASQAAEDYPKDNACTIQIAADAAIGPHAWRAWTSQGVTPIAGSTNEPRAPVGMRFIVGDLPEVVEQEIDGSPLPVRVNLPLTINGRIFPRENVDTWAFHASAGQQITCDACARRIGSPLDAELLVFDPAGKPVHATLVHVDGDPRLHFTAATDGIYQVRIHDVAYGGLQNYVYRLTLTAGPCVDSIYPLGGRRGSKVHFDLAGSALQSSSADMELPTEQHDPYLHAFDQGGQRANPVAIDLDDLPEFLEAEPNDHPSDVKPVAIPAVLNGRIDHPGDVDYWAFEARKNQALDLDLRASRLGSPLDSVLSIEDAQGKQLFRNDDLAAGQPDSQLAFKAPADGVYYIRVEDRFPSRGGSNYAYRLRVAQAEPGFRLTVASDAVTLPRMVEVSNNPPDKKTPPASANLRVDMQRLGGFEGPVNLAIEGLPEGVTAANTAIPAHQVSVTLKLTAAPKTKISLSHLRIRGTADNAGKPLSNIASMTSVPGIAPVEDILLAVAIPTPFKATGVYQHPFVPCGSIFHRQYVLDRGGFTGPLTVRIADRQIRHLQGVQGPVMVIPPGADSFDYWVALPPEMELGRTSRSMLMLTGVVKDFDGSEHTVSFSSPEPNDQFVCVATAPLLTLRLDQSSLLAGPGQTVDLPIRIQRAQTLASQSVKVEMIVPASVHDVQADSFTLTPSQSQGTLHIHFGPTPGPFALPVTIRATAPGPDDPSHAEAKVEFVPVPGDHAVKP